MWPFSVRLLVVFHRIWGGSGGLEGGPVLALKIPCITLWSGSSSISTDYTSLPLWTGGNQEHVHPWCVSQCFRPLQPPVVSTAVDVSLLWERKARWCPRISSLLQNMTSCQSWRELIRLNRSEMKSNEMEMRRNSNSTVFITVKLFKLLFLTLSSESVHSVKKIIYWEVWFILVNHLFVRFKLIHW